MVDPSAKDQRRKAESNRQEAGTDGRGGVLRSPPPLPSAPASCRLVLHGLRNTFKTPFLRARSIACTPLESGYSSLIRLSISIAPLFKRSSAGWNRPQREPTILISSTTRRA